MEILAQFSLESIALTAVNLVISAVLAVMGFILKRMIVQNDKEHAQLAETIKELRAEIKEEREARHQFHTGLSDRVHEVAKDLGSNYETKVDAMTRFGNMLLRLDAHHKETVDAIRMLPCLKAACPNGDKD